MGLPLQAGQGVTNYLLYGLAMNQSTIDDINDAFWWATLGTDCAHSVPVVRRVKVGKARPLLPKPDDMPNARYLVESKETGSVPHTPLIRGVFPHGLHPSSPRCSLSHGFLIFSTDTTHMSQV